MPIIACGINHKTAPIALREQVVFAPEKIPFYLNDLQQNEAIQEVVLLSTCNRTEIYCQVDHPQLILDWFRRQQFLLPEILEPLLYCYQDEAAVNHMMSVACGLDSLVVGEPQILGQMKQAFSESCAAGSIGPLFHRLFQQLFAIAKEVRTSTAIGACPVSVVSTTVTLLKQLFSKPLSDASILLIGAGDTIALMLRHLAAQQVKNITVINRDVEKAIQLATPWGYISHSFSALPALLETSDILISATQSTIPILTYDFLAPILEKRSSHALLLIDLAVPRDIEEKISTINNNIKLFSIDDLKIIIQQHLKGREHAAEKAQEIIQLKSKEWMAWAASFHQTTAAIRTYRQQMETLCQAQLQKALRQLQQGEEPAQVLTRFAHTLTNKLLHTPTIQLRQAGITKMAPS